jgi:hypothetical protein
VVAASAAVAGRLTPRSVIRVGTLMVVGGLTLAGATVSVPLWIAALIVAGIGIGIGETGALGLLLESVGVSRIVFAMVLWSQMRILGYMAGPLTGGTIAERFGFEGISLVAFAAAIVLLGLVRVKGLAAA